MKITPDMMYDMLVDEWIITKDKLYGSEDIKEIKELVKYLEALNTLLEKYERGYV